jgi:cytochrome c
MPMKPLACIAFLMLLTLPAMAQDDDGNGEAQFRRCLPCHAVGEGAANKVGPQLNGIVDSMVASLPEYNYSQTLTDAGNEGLEWDRQLLTRYLKSPRHVFPGTSMTFAGMRKRAEIDAIIDYLAGFDENGARTDP